MRIKSVFVLVVMAAFAFSVKANAADRNVAAATAVTADGKVVFAVHPYFSKTDRKHIHANSWSYIKPLPVGVMIQNYGDKEIIIDKINIVSVLNDKVSVYDAALSGDRVPGEKADRFLDDDSAVLNKYLNSIYGKGRERLVVRRNERFDCQRLEPGQACYGLVFIEKKNVNERLREIQSLSGLYLDIKFKRNAINKPFVARVSLDAMNGGVVRTVEH